DAVGAGEQPGERLGRDIDASDLQTHGGGVRLLQLRVVVVGERIDRDDVVPGGLQRLGEVRTDEARGAGDDVAHGRGGYRPAVTRILARRVEYASPWLEVVAKEVELAPPRGRETF